MVYHIIRVDIKNMKIALVYPIFKMDRNIFIPHKTDTNAVICLVGCGIGIFIYLNYKNNYILFGHPVKGRNITHGVYGVLVMTTQT